MNNLRPYRFVDSRHFNGGHTIGPIQPMQTPRRSLIGAILASLTKREAA